MSCTPSVTVPHTTHVLDASKGPQDTVELTGSRSASSYLHKMPEDWDAEEVADWVTDKGFKSWASLFIEQEITGDVLVDLGLSSLRELGIELLGDRIKVLQQILLLKDEPQKEVKGEQQVPVSPASETDEKILVPVVGDLHEHHPTLERSHSKKKSSQPPPLVTESASSESSPPSTSTLHSVVTLERDLEASIQTHYQTLERQGIVSKKAEDETRDSTLLSPNLRLLDSPSRSDAAPSESVQPTTYHQHGMLPPVVVNRPQDSPVATSLPKPSNSSHFTISDYASESSMPQSPFGSPSHHHHTSQTQQQQPSLATASVRQLNHQTSYSYSIDTRRNPEDESKLNSQSPQASRDRDSGNVLESFLKRIQNIRQTSYPEAQQQIQESLTLDQSQDSLLVTFADYEGHLNVRLSPTQNWKKRYCMLKDGDLFVFKQSDQQRLLARVPIEKQYAVTPDDHQSKNKFSFRIVRADSRFIQFATESQLSMVQWITAFVRAGQSGIPFLIEYDILIELPRSGTDSDRKRKAQLLPVRRTKDTKPLPEVPA